MEVFYTGKEQVTLLLATKFENVLFLRKEQLSDMQNAWSGVV